MYTDGWCKRSRGARQQFPLKIVPALVGRLAGSASASATLQRWRNGSRNRGHGPFRVKGLA